MIQFKHVQFGYQKTFLDDVSFTIKKGDFVCIVGPNGSGKTSLVKLISGFLKPKKGTIRVTGSVSYVPQRAAIDPLFPGTVRELLRCVTTRGTCTHLGVESLLDKQFSKLSGGEQQRALIALALEKNPDILILDEPTIGLDVKNQQALYTLLSHLNTAHKLTILLVTHEMHTIPKLANRALCLGNHCQIPKKDCLVHHV
ncbi:MAG: metal ABC transporter ATP-binding protein [Candidatus Woesearchaeota archaeon]